MLLLPLLPSPQSISIYYQRILNMYVPFDNMFRYSTDIYTNGQTYIHVYIQLPTQIHVCRKSIFSHIWALNDNTNKIF